MQGGRPRTVFRRSASNGLLRIDRSVKRRTGRVCKFAAMNCLAVALAAGPGDVEITPPSAAEVDSSAGMWLLRCDSSSGYDWRFICIDDGNSKRCPEIRAWEGAAS